jgi:hypothetical protein
VAPYTSEHCHDRNIPDRPKGKFAAMALDYDTRVHVGKVTINRKW